MSLAAAYILVSSGSMPAMASGIAKAIEPQPDAPVHITDCSGRVQFFSNRWGTNSSILTTGVDFKNVSSKVAVAVLFRLQFSNAFGDIMDNRFGQATGEFAPSTEVDGNHWSQDDIWAGLGAIRCSVNRVLFADGSVWREAAGAGTDAPNATPSP